MIKVIKNGIVITMDEKRKEKYEKLDIVIKDDTIIDLVENYNGDFDEIIDASNKIVMPGLINGHTHLGMSIFRATNDNLNLQDWLTKKIWPIENNMNDDDMYYTTLLSLLEMIKTGTTTSNDMYFCAQGELKAINEAKVRCMFSRTLIGDTDESGLSKINELESLINNNTNPLITYSIAIHGLYTTSKEYMIKCKELADKYNLPIHMHFSENVGEIETIKTNYNTTPVGALKELGMLDNKLILAHSTFVSDNDLTLFKNIDVSFVHNPVSNLNLGCGFADITKYKKNNINICLGTDGQGSGNNLNMFYHMSFVDFIQKGLYKDPTIASSYETLKMATINGAKALGLDKQIGSIEINKKADIIILDYNNVEVFPTVDLITQVVHNTESNNVDTTIINGEILMQNHELVLPINEIDLKENINKIINRLM